MQKFYIETAGVGKTYTKVNHRISFQYLICVLMMSFPRITIVQEQIILTKYLFLVGT